MDSETFRSRAVKLLQKSRKAMRLYSNMGKGSSARSRGYATHDTRRSLRLKGPDLSEVQADQWREVNAELTEELSRVLDGVSPRVLKERLFTLRDHFYQIWRTTEAELHEKQDTLIAASEKGDFVKAALLSSELVGLKARMQASHAAHHEIQSVISSSRIKTPDVNTGESGLLPGIEQDSPVVPLAQVIPLRARHSG